MGIDYNACLAYGYKVGDTLDREKYEDGMHEPQVAWVQSANPGIPSYGDEYRAVLAEDPCPIQSVTFGSAYGGPDDVWFVIGQSDYLFVQDLYRCGTIEQVGTPDPAAVKDDVRRFCERVGIDIPEGEPAWYFGGYVY